MSGLEITKKISSCVRARFRAGPNYFVQDCFVILNPRAGLILNKESRLITLRLKRDVENYDLMRTKGMKPGGRVNIRSHIQEELNSDLGTQKNDPECPHQVPATLTKVGFQIDAL